MKVERISMHFETKVPGRHDYSNITVGASFEATLDPGENRRAALEELHAELVLFVRDKVIERLNARPKSERTGHEQEAVDALDTP